MVVVTPSYQSLPATPLEFQKGHMSQDEHSAPSRVPITTMKNLLKVGHITPSCNTVVEPVVAMMSRPVETEFSNHFTRIPVGNISLASADIAQFEVSTMVGAASILAEAHMDAIVWNGTSGSWNGAQADRELSDAITAATGVPATTSTLAQLDILRRVGVSRIGLFTPYTPDVTDRIVATYAAEGIEVVSRMDLGLTAGREMANVPIARVRELLRQANSPEAQAVVVICTGLPAAFTVDDMEAELGKPVFDSIAVTLKAGMELAGSSAVVAGWGSVMAGDEVVLSLLEGEPTPERN